MIVTNGKPRLDCFAALAMTAVGAVCPNAINSISQHERHGVWVPASAGTTSMRSDEPIHSLREIGHGLEICKRVTVTFNRTALNRLARIRHGCGQAADDRNRLAIDI